MSNAKANRNAGIEILRIVAMFAIVYGHCISHGGGFTVSEEINNPLHLAEELFRSLTAFKVNVFVLITGFFMLNIEDFSVKKRLSGLWKNEIFYSVIIMLIFLVCSVPIGKINIVKSIIPTVTYSYWFVTVYVVLILIAPIINKAFSKMERKQYKKFLIVMIGFASIWQTAMPFITTIDNSQGFSLLWFTVLYAIGGYLKKFVVEKHFSKKKLLLIWFAGSIMQFGYRIFYAYVENRRGMEIKIPLYNSFFILCSSIALFLLFYQLRISNSLGKIVTFISGSLISVYLISDNGLVRSVLYTNILKTQNYQDNGIFSILAITLMAVIVFIVCLMIDIIKRFIVDKVKLLH